MNILVCGGRDYEKEYRMREVLAQYFHQGDVLIHGCSRGADMLSERILLRIYPTMGVAPCIRRFPANWDKYKKAAGPIRNKQMLEEGKPDLVIAFPGGKGTAHMVKIAKEAGVKVIEISN